MEKDMQMKQIKKKKSLYSAPTVRNLGKIIRETAGSGANSGTDQNVYAKNSGSAS